MSDIACELPNLGRCIEFLVSLNAERNKEAAETPFFSESQSIINTSSQSKRLTRIWQSLRGSEVHKLN